MRKAFKESEAVSKGHIALLHQFHHLPAACILGHIHVKQLHSVLMLFAKRNIKT